MPILIATRLLKPLGNPPQNGIKFFSTQEVLELVKDRSWLAKMTNTICQYWHKQNAKCSAAKGSPVASVALLDCSQSAAA